MMKNLILSLFIMLIGSYCYGQGGFEGIIVEEIDASASGSDLTAYRVFVDLEPGHELQQVRGNAANPLNIATTTSWFNEPTFGAVTGDGINSALIPVFPDVEFDSFVSLGAASSTEWGVLTSDDPSGRMVLGPINGVSSLGEIDLAGNFGSGAASNSLTVDTDGQFFTLTSNADVAPGNRIYIGQFTTDGDFSFSINIQTRIAGTNDFTVLNASEVPELNYSSASGPMGCSDMNACNYDPAVDPADDDGSCTYPVSCDDGDACTADSEDQCDPLDCTNVEIDCDDGDPSTTDTCDPLTGCMNVTTEINGCTDSSAANYDASANIDDGSCLYDVTFNVDMNCESNFTEPALESPLFGWCGGCVPLSDLDNDGVYSVTVQIPAGAFEYKYAVDAFTSQEDLIDDMIDGGTCAPITDFSTFANRSIDVMGGLIVNDV